MKKIIASSALLLLSACASNNIELNQPFEVSHEGNAIEKNNGINSFGKTAFEQAVVSSSCEIWKAKTLSEDTRMSILCDGKDITIYTAKDTYNITFNYVNENDIYYNRVMNKDIDSWAERSRINEHLDTLDNYISINTEYLYNLHYTVRNKKSINYYLNKFRTETSVVPEFPLDLENAKLIFESTLFNDEWFNAQFSRNAINHETGLIHDQKEMEDSIISAIKPALRLSFKGVSIEYCDPSSSSFTACAVTASPLNESILFEDNYLEAYAHPQEKDGQISYVIEVKNKSKEKIDLVSADLLLNNLRFNTHINEKELSPNGSTSIQIKHKPGWSPTVTVMEQHAATYYGISIDYIVMNIDKEFKEHSYYNPIMMLNNQ